MLHWQPSYCSCRGHSHCANAVAATIPLLLSSSCISFFCCFCVAGTATALLQQHVGCSSLQPTPAWLPIQGLWGCYTSNLLAAAVAIVLLWLWQLSCCNCHAATFQLLLSCCKRGSRFAAAACGLQLSAANPHPVTNARALGALHKQPSCDSCSYRAAVAAAVFRLQLSCTSLSAAAFTLKAQ